MRRIGTVRANRTAQALGAGIAAAWLLGAALGAEAGPARAGAVFDRLDADGDGRISEAEVREARERRLSRMDRDGDGAVNRAEMRAHAMARVERRVDRRFGRLDADGDGRVDAGEMETRAAVRFARADRNGDEAISRDEFDAAMGRLRERFAQ